jgi:glycosyltransferase involved in cell wall biosynthesis
MTRRILNGMKRAALVFYLTDAIRRQIESFGLLDPARLIWAPPAPAEEFTQHGGTEARKKALELAGSERYVLHVGSCIARKRIDVLLDVFARVRKPGLKLLQVGGEWTPQQRTQIEKLKIGESVVQAARLPREIVAALYRGAAVVIQPSESEGFGLPVIEALACGAPVVASDIPVLREVGGDAVVYCPVADVGRWSEVICGLLNGRTVAPPVEKRLAQAAKLSWQRHADTIAGAYRRLWDGGAA